MMNPDAPAIANIEAECALLGAMMIENRLIDRVADIVRAEDFAEPFMGRLFTLAMREHNLGKLANQILDLRMEVTWLDRRRTPLRPADGFWEETHPKFSPYEELLRNLKGGRRERDRL